MGSRSGKGPPRGLLGRSWIWPCQGQFYFWPLPERAATARDPHIGPASSILFIFSTSGPQPPNVSKSQSSLSIFPEVTLLNLFLIDKIKLNKIFHK